MDELEQRIRAARPISGHRDLPLSDRSKRELAELMLIGSAHSASRGPLPLRRRRALRGISATAAIALIAVIGAITATSVLAPQPAYAATPPLLSITPTDQTAQELLTELSQKAAAASDASGTGMFTIRVETWTLPVEKTPPRVIVPEVHVVVRTANGSGTQVVTYGVAVDAAGNPVTGPGVPPEGRIIRTETFTSPVQLQPLPSQGDGADGAPSVLTDPVTLYTVEVPDDPGAMGEFLDATIGTDAKSGAAAAIRTMNELLFEQLLSPRQQSALLAYFADLPDITAAGTTVDRLGRDGAVFEAVDPDQPDYRQQLIISTETGRILGTEIVYVGADRTDIPSPSVVHYSVWR